MIWFRCCRQSSITARESASASKGETSGAAGGSRERAPVRATARPAAPNGYAGFMFWLTRNRLPGSYFLFTWASRAWLSRYAAFTLSSPSSIIMLR
jgi:hypothetical protein